MDKEKSISEELKEFEKEKDASVAEETLRRVREAVRKMYEGNEDSFYYPHHLFNDPN